MQVNIPVTWMVWVIVARKIRQFEPFSSLSSSYFFLPERRKTSEFGEFYIAEVTRRILIFLSIDSRDKCTCTPNSVIAFNLGILGDYITHKYPRDIGLTLGFFIGYIGRGTSNYPLIEFSFSSKQVISDCGMAVPSVRYVLAGLEGVKMGVSKNTGTPKSSILIGFSGFSLINHPFWCFFLYFWVDTQIKMLFLRLSK